jgi:hypothetical protein
VNLSTAAFVQGVPLHALPRDEVESFLTRDGYVFFAFRAMPPFVSPAAIADRRKILLVCYPRDMIVSNYLSIRQSHTIPRVGETRANMLSARALALRVDIDTYALSGHRTYIMRNYRSYMSLIDSSWRVYRYEDVVLQKQNWIQDMSAYADLPVAPSQLVKIASKHDIVPQDEDPSAHIRQVLPGNYKKHLQRETIAALNDSLSDILSRFNYDT